MTLIGIDCATSPKKVGLALATGGRLVEATTGSNHAHLVDTLVSWLSSNPRSLIALDAPLGWPSPLSRVLSDHHAGEPIDVSAHSLFRRATDRFVRASIGKQPLDVGADRIARTAHAALALLHELRGRTGSLIPLAWNPGESRDSHEAIEVYPAATLVAHGLPASGYKSRDGHQLRSEITARLTEHLSFDPELGERLTESDHVLDAAVCVLAAQDFLAGHASAPPSDEERELARREGWIWFKRPE